MTEKINADELMEAIRLNAQDYRDRNAMGNAPVRVGVPDRFWEALVARDLPEKALREHNIHVRPNSGLYDMEGEQ